jgi:hypothetical protein
MSLHDLENRLGKLEKALSAFSQELRLALRYIQADAGSSLTKSRLVLEKLLIQVYTLEMGQDPRKPLLGDMLVDNQFTRKIERRILSRMNAIRDMGNLGPHGEFVKPNDAARVLEDLCEVLEWYLHRYAGSTPILLEVGENASPEKGSLIDEGAQQVSQTTRIADSVQPETKADTGQHTSSILRFTVKENSVDANMLYIHLGVPLPFCSDQFKYGHAGPDTHPLVQRLLNITGLVSVFIKSAYEMWIGKAELVASKDLIPHIKEAFERELCFQVVEHVLRAEGEKPAGFRPGDVLYFAHSVGLPGWSALVLTVSADGSTVRLAHSFHEVKPERILAWTNGCIKTQSGHVLALEAAAGSAQASAFARKLHGQSEDYLSAGGENELPAWCRLQRLGDAKEICDILSTLQDKAV